MACCFASPFQINPFFPVSSVVLYTSWITARNEYIKISYQSDFQWQRKDICQNSEEKEEKPGLGKRQVCDEPMNQSNYS
jgi:hypothetical protein